LSAPHEETKTELVIDRKRWLRGEGAAASKLLRPEDGKMCCLGFYGLSCGLGEAELLDACTPGSRGGMALWPAWMGSRDEGADNRGLAWDVWQLMSFNDDEPTESKIAAIFARHGVTVRFVDEPEAQIDAARGK
jgi:hypothetical protein